MRDQMSTTLEEINKQIAVLQSKVAVLQKQKVVRSVETAKSYADAFIRKLEADGIPLEVGLQALRDLVRLSSSARRAR